MQNCNSKLKIIFLWLVVLFFSGCAENKNRPADPVSFQGKGIVSSIETKNNQPIKILFVGDMMFDRYIREVVERRDGDYSFILEPVKNYLSQFDLVVGNLEGPITDKKSVSAGTTMDEKINLIFSFDPVTAKVLAENNIKLVNLGNNHTLNQGEEGIYQTKNYLNEAGVKYFDDSAYQEIEFPGGMKVAWVGYNYSVQGSAEKTLDNIRKAKEQGDIVIVAPHWGTEYKIGEPGTKIEALARSLIDAGADAIIGTHPHVVQKSELYKGKKICYSLGNFVFDQYFRRETMEGMGVEMTIDPETKNLDFQEVRFEMTKNGQTKLKN